LNSIRRRTGNQWSEYSTSELVTRVHGRVPAELLWSKPPKRVFGEPRSRSFQLHFWLHDLYSRGPIYPESVWPGQLLSWLLQATIATCGKWAAEPWTTRSHHNAKTIQHGHLKVPATLSPLLILHHQQQCIARS